MTGPDILEVYKLAARDYVYSEIYHLQKEGKINSTNAKKAFKELIVKANKHEIKVPQKYFDKWWAKSYE